MIAKTRVITAACITVVAVVLYLWGHLDGREGRTTGLIAESCAADSPPAQSPVKAPAPDLY
jgi:hypothetical protein